MLSITGIVGFYSQQNKAFIFKQCYLLIMLTAKRKSFRTTMHDGNVHILSCFDLMNIGMVIQFQGKLKEQQLIKAIKLSIEKIPVLKSIFVKKWRHAWWQEKENIDIHKIVKIVRSKNDTSDHIDFFFNAP